MGIERGALRVEIFTAQYLAELGITPACALQADVYPDAGQPFTLCMQSAYDLMGFIRESQPRDIKLIASNDERSDIILKALHGARDIDPALYDLAMMEPCGNC
jgi:hypothetical protein